MSFVLTMNGEEGRLVHSGFHPVGHSPVRERVARLDPDNPERFNEVAMGADWFLSFAD